jgi:hypothetical protein
VSVDRRLDRPGNFRVVFADEDAGGAHNASARMELINSIGGHDGGPPRLTSRATVSLNPCLCRIDRFLKSLPQPGKPGGYVVRDANGQALAYVYSRDNEDEARQAKVLTKDAARRIAVNVARLLELLGKGEGELGGAAAAPAHKRYGPRGRP